MTSYTNNLLISLPTPGDPAATNAWGAILNNDFSLLDAAIAGYLTLSVAGASNVILTSTPGIADEARNAIFSFTGALTGNIDVLWPQNVTGFFIVQNLTSGAQTLSVGSNNGSGAPAGSVVTISQGRTAVVFSDGTNFTATSGNWIESIVPAASPVSFSAGSGNPQTLTSIPLLIGDWDVAGLATGSGLDSTSVVISGISTATNVQPTGENRSYATGSTNISTISSVAPRRRFSVTAPITLYLVVTMVFVGTPTMAGFLNARSAG